MKVSDFIAAERQPANGINTSQLAIFWTRAKPLLIVGTVLITVVGFVLFISLSYLHPLSIRLDESQSIWQASHSYGMILEVVAKDVHVPLYHLLLHTWMVFFGDTITAARTLSTLFLVASVPVVYLLARRLLSMKWALLVVTLYAINPFILWYGSEARMYSLLMLLAFTNQYFFVGILKHNKGWLGYTLTAMVGVYSHYFFIFALLTQAVFYAFNYQKFTKGSLKKFAFIAGLLFVVMLPWVLYFRSLGSAGETSPSLPEPSTIDFFNVYSQFIFGFQSNTVNTLLLSAWPLVILAVFWIIQRNARDNATVNYFIFAAFLPALIAYGLSLIIKPFFLNRYMITLFAPLLILLVWFISNYAKAIRVLVAIAVTSAFVLGSTMLITGADVPIKEDYQSAVTYLESNATPRDVIVLSAPFTVYPFEYYYNGFAAIETFPRWDRVNALPGYDATTMSVQFDDIRKNHEYMHVLLSHDQGYEEELEQYLDTNLEKTYEKQYSEGLTLHTYKVGYYVVPELGTFTELNF